MNDGLVQLAYEIESHIIFFIPDAYFATHEVFLNYFLDNNVAMHYVDPGNNFLLTDTLSKFRSSCGQNCFICFWNNEM